MIQFRPFHNSDPPLIAKLWQAAELSRGAASSLRCDAFETLNYAQPYFDRNGLILAVDDDENVVGLVHAGFGRNDTETGLMLESGVICMILVHPNHRRRGLGRELVTRAEEYMKHRGATNIFAGPAEPLDPFYFGMYGGSQPSGFLLSDEKADHFFKALGYQPFERHAVFQRDISQPNDPTNMRLVSIRRKMQLAIAHQREEMSWWWITRFGRLDSVRFQLVPKDRGEAVAEVTVLGLDLYLEKWQERAIGLTDLRVEEDERRKGYGQTLLIEVCRRMREEMVTRVEAHASETNAGALAVLQSAGFKREDTGVVYLKVNEETTDIDPDKETVEIASDTGTKVQEFVSPKNGKSELADGTTIHYDE
ncbi:MAG: GNAT family N-acetyltransferase [Planctomycetaceae bacterium]|nr:GNAT family N-acetyltransferase [Planctomycetaceae bacterium]